MRFIYILVVFCSRYVRILEQAGHAIVDIAVLLGAGLVAGALYRLPSFLSSVAISLQRPSRDSEAVMTVHTVTPMFHNRTQGTRLRFRASPNGKDFDPAAARGSLVLYVLNAERNGGFWRACESGLGETKLNIGRALLPLRLSSKFLQDPQTVKE